VTSLAQLDEDLDAWGTTLSPELLKAIDAIRWELRDPALVKRTEAAHRLASAAPAFLRRLRRRSYFPPGAVIAFTNRPST
jgi:hypothetical protein